MHSLALRADGVVVAWGNNSSAGGGFVPRAGRGRGAAGYYHNTALRADGRVIAWGYDGQLTGFGFLTRCGCNNECGSDCCGLES